MHGRLSKLRRSLSRSVHQLNSALPNLSRSSTNLLELPPSTCSTLVNKYGSAQTFSQLRNLVSQHNEALREIVSVFEEKAAADFAYAKTMHRLSQRLLRISQDAECEVDRGWTAVAEHFNAHGTLHSNLGTAISDDLVQPLRTVLASETSTIRTAHTLVDREVKKWKEKREEVGKMKRNVYISSKELEKMDQLIDADSSNANRFALKRKKLKDQVKKGEDAYLFTLIDVEKQRRTMSNVICKSVESLEAVERQRLAHCQTALGRLQRKMEQLGPSLQQIFSRFADALDPAVDCDCGEYISSLQPSTSAVHTVTLIDLYSENFSEIIVGERRRASLVRISHLLDAELRRMYTKEADLHTPELTLLEFVEFLYYKINEALNSIEGGNQRGHHRLAKFQHKTKDKQGLPHTVLSIPQGDDVFNTPQALPFNGRHNGTPPTDTYAPPSDLYADSEYYDNISDEGFYNSSGPRSVDGQVIPSQTEVPSTSNHKMVLERPEITVTPPPVEEEEEEEEEEPSRSEVSTVLEVTPEVRDEPQNRPNLRRQTTIIDDPATICRVLYDFTAQLPDELTVHAGECVIVEERLGDDWLIGHLIDKTGGQHRGRFPTTYVTF